MTAAQPAAPRPLVLADLVPGRLVRDVALVTGAAALTGLAAQVSIHIPGTPVPVTGQTFAVLLSGAALGSVRGLASMLVYLVAGVAGVPWFAGHAAGFGGPSFGYLLGFVLAAAVVGWLAERRGDRSPARTVATMLAGTVLIYVAGVPWLMAAAHVGLDRALVLGVQPFLVGDAIKIAIAAGLLPAAWALARR